MVSLEWLDVQPAIGTKVSDYVLQHKKVDEYTDTDLYTGGCSFVGKFLSVQGVPGDASRARPGWEPLLLWRTAHRAAVLCEGSNPLHSGEVSEGCCRRGYLRGRGNTKMQQGRKK